ncbi:MAG: extracellular solute-binding protein [Patescibacteria group bacterium]
MKNISKFQIAVLGIFGVFIIVGILIFALGKTGGGGSVVPLLVWGTMPNTEFSEVISKTGLDKNETLKIDYVQKSKDNFDIEFLEALASGIGPDLFFLSSDSLLKYKDRVFVVPFSSFSEGDFTKSFIEGAEVFLVDEGVSGFPVLVDPLVMYWNRDIFNSEGLVAPPRFWDEIYNLATNLTHRDSSSELTRSGVALGEYGNVSNAFEILSTLIMQAGNPITKRVSGGVQVVLNQKFNLPTSPAEQSLSFYTGFSNSDKTFYSWNRSLPRSRDYFLSGDLGVYFGLASELFELRDKNPNLNFDVAMIPQTKEVGKSVVYGRVEAIMINKQSRNIPSAFLLARALSGDFAVSALSKIKSLPGTRRDLLSEKPERAYMEVFFASAIIAKPWLSPDMSATRLIFKDMIESVTGGRARTSEAVNRAYVELNSLLSF